MVGLKLSTGAAILTGCSAFAPTTHLRSETSVSSSSTGVASFQLSPTTSLLTDVSAVSSGTLLGLTGGALALLASRRGQRRALERSAVGICAPLTEKFDPLNLASSEEKLARYTEAEIKHGRVAMIACVGYVMPEVFRFPGCENFENGLGALTTLPAEGWIQLVAFMGAHEILVKARPGGMGPSDFGLGTELLEGKPAEEVERRQTSERNNGRLAMIGIMGLMVQDAMFETSPIALLKSGGWWGTSVDYIIKDIPICAGTTGCAMKRAARGAGRTSMRAVVYTDPFPKLPDEPEVKMSEATPYLQKPMQLEGWVGDKGFDPLSVTDALPVYLVREAELKHGRVCMLATVGWIATDLGVRFPGEVFQNVSTLQAHDAMVKAGLMQPFIATIGCLELYGGFLLLQGLSEELPREAGDFFVGKQFLPQEPAKATDMKLKELENGRLAMMAFSGIATAAALTGKTWPFL
mmetsp:Transcript_46245/g.100532  ORF Transcript_46245/g.100532 Transcript_46245/m.100532 type:complete len:465 (+) Transcript_46245:67-1461(+)|eukprot:CAMPEP_0170600760 /NCGR_PEP_ID=MMETSP0224-20130122/17502_1 /TAXON_ID=285029 /ORGANISM="Togula jolla, Strain CCCM 725" /LENGTH=464 /DNA_ID=CAMNT_0010925499 /DNA_START=57 /DNA_END=1451 /DNA_ORIENTATION=-